MPTLVNHWRSSQRGMPLVVAPFLSPRTRQRLEQAGACYLDLTGNIRLVADRPGLFVQASGADVSPWRENRPVRSLKGPKAGRVVRALCDFVPPLGVRDLAQRTRINAGYVSRILGLLDREDLIERAARGPVTSVDWQGLIRRWVRDYSPFGRDRIRSYLAPRGLSATIDKLRGVGIRYALSGDFAAARIAPVAPPRLLLCYVDDPEAAAARLDLRTAEAGANVILAWPFDEVVYERTRQLDGLAFGAPSQIAADLLASPGRGPAEAEALIKWMAEHERAWRS